MLKKIKSNNSILKVMIPPKCDKGCYFFEDIDSKIKWCALFRSLMMEGDENKIPQCLAKPEIIIEWGE